MGGTIREIAASITGSSWSEDGPKILAITDKRFADIASFFKDRDFWFWDDDNTTGIISAMIATEVKNIDDEFNWDFPRMSESTEDYMYTWLVSNRVKQLSWKKYTDLKKKDKEEKNSA